MSLVRAQGLSLSYGKKTLLDDTSFAVGPHDRIALVGANGTGKSTLLKILADQLQPDSGSLQLRRQARRGYLAQELVGLPEGALIDAVLSSVPGRTELETRLAEVEAALPGATDPDEQLDLAQALSDLHQELEHFEERHGERQAERILRGLGFTQEDLRRPTETFSGGWRMRAALGALLLQDPDLLLLDEPTNHLDIPTLAWFDNFLRRSKKALVLVSHDRDFLNRQVNRVLSLEVEGLRSYAGNYDAYRTQRALEAEQRAAAAARQQAKRDELVGFIERFGAKATKARQAQSRAKQLEKMEVIDLLEERRSMRFRFPEAPSLGREVVRLAGIHKAFGEKVIYRDLSAMVERGQRVAVVGANGAGKTTLLKLMAGELPADRGEVKLGASVTMGYYAQHHTDKLNKRATILEELAQTSPTTLEGQLRSVAGAFLFSGDDIHKPVGVLSGGERARVALAKLLLTPANLLLMDEPTNHLDLDSTERLIEALKEYSGTLVFVSHTRSFINELATHVWDVRDGQVVVYPGNLDDYLHHVALEQPSEPAVDASARGAASEPDGPGGLSPKERRRLEAEGRARRNSVEGPLRKQIAKLERRIAELEAKVGEAEAQLADPVLYNDFARAQPVLDAHREAKEELDQLLGTWEQAQQQLEAATGST